MGWVSGQAYSEDLRARVVSAVDRGGRVYEIVSYIYKALARRRLHGIETTLPKVGRPGRKLDHHLDVLAGYVAAHPDVTLAELVEWMERDRGVKVCVATMWATLDALDLSRKKRPATPRSRSGKMLPPPAKHGARPRAA
jgi:transposase